MSSYRLIYTLRFELTQKLEIRGERDLKEPEQSIKYEYVPLWALLPALKNRGAAERYLREGHRWLGRPLNEWEVAYFQDVMESRVSAWRNI